MTNKKSPPDQVSRGEITYSQAEFDEAYEIGKRDGYSDAVQEIDQLTGGDGEYRYCLGMEDSERHTPDPATMIKHIVDRFEILNLLDDATKTGSDQPDDGPLPTPTDNRHEFVPNRKYPWFCAHCGYSAHEVLKHFQPSAKAEPDRSKFPYWWEGPRPSEKIIHQVINNYMGEAEREYDFDQFKYYLNNWHGHYTLNQRMKAAMDASASEGAE